MCMRIASSSIDKYANWTVRCFGHIVAHGPTCGVGSSGLQLQVEVNQRRYEAPYFVSRYRATEAGERKALRRKAWTPTLLSALWTQCLDQEGRDASVPLRVSELLVAPNWIRRSGPPPPGGFSVSA